MKNALSLALALGLAFSGVVPGQAEENFAKRLVQIGGGLSFWVTPPDAGPEDRGFRLSFVLLFPR